MRAGQGRSQWDEDDDLCWALPRSPLEQEWWLPLAKSKKCQIRYSSEVHKLFNKTLDWKFQLCMSRTSDFWTFMEVGLSHNSFIATLTNLIITSSFFCETAWRHGESSRPKWRIFYCVTTPSRLFSVAHVGNTKNYRKDSHLMWEAPRWISKSCVDPNETGRQATKQYQRLLKQCVTCVTCGRW